MKDLCQIGVTFKENRYHIDMEGIENIIRWLGRDIGDEALTATYRRLRHVAGKEVVSSDLAT